MIPLRLKHKVIRIIKTTISFRAQTAVTLLLDRLLALHRMWGYNFSFPAFSFQLFISP
jgi:hypothetical protein